MTQRQAKHLAIRQIALAHEKLFSIRLKQKKGVSFILLKEIMQKSEDGQVIVRTKNYLVGRVIQKKDRKALAFMMKYSLPKNNSNELARSHLAVGFYNLANKGVSNIVPHLTMLMNDSVHEVKYWALSGLRELAKKGNDKTIPGLKKGLKDERYNNQLLAIEGLVALAKKGNKEADGLIGKYRRREL
jgi:hypothetical protein